MKKKLFAVLLTAFIVASSFPVNISVKADTNILDGKKAVFIHHSTGGQWLADSYGNLGTTLKDKGLFLSDICYEWDAPQNTDIGSYTDIGNWYTWFADTTKQANGIDKRDNIMNAVYTEYGKDSYSQSTYGDYTRLTDPDANAENTIVIIKSCYPNSDIYADNSSDSIFGQTVNEHYTESNVRAVYNAILPYMLAHPEKLFVIVTAPPRSSYDEQENGTRARAFNNWLVNDWLDGNENKNVYVWDYFNVLTDADNYHKTVNGTVVHHTEKDSGNITIDAYHESGDEHPNAAADQKATEQFVPCLEAYAQTWVKWQSTQTATNASVNPESAEYDKYTATSGVDVVLTAESYTLSAIKNGDSTLNEGTDYTVNGNTYTISKAYLDALPEGTATLIFDMSGGTDVTFTVTVLNTAPVPPEKYDVIPNINGGASKLYEPWGLRYFAVFIGDDADKITDRGIAILKSTYYTSDMTEAEFIANANAYVYTSNAGELGFEDATKANPNGRYYATLTEGIYSYDIGSRYYVLPFAIMEDNQVIYGTIKYNSMENILNKNLDSSSISSSEKGVCRCILDLKASVGAHYAATGVPGALKDIVIPRGSSQIAASSVKTAEQCGITPNITAGASRLIEPWGLRYFAVYNASSESTSISDYGIAVLCEKYYDASYNTNPDAMRCSANAYVFRTSDNTLLYDSAKNRYYSTLTEGITSKDISDVYYVVPFAVLSDGSYVYGTVKSNSMLRIMNVNLSLSTVSPTEKAVNQDIIDLYNAVKTYYGL